MKLNMQSVKQRLALGAVAVVVALVLVAVVSYLAGRRAGQTPEVVEGRAQVLAAGQLLMDASAGDEYPGGTGAFDVTGAWWTADGVTHRAETPPSCLTPGATPRVRLAVLEVRGGEHRGPARWVVTHVECLD